MTGDIYIIDTSSIANLVFYPNKYKDFEPYWKNLKILIHADKLKIPSEVFNEASRGHPLIVAWIDNYKNKLIYENEGMYVKLSEVLKKYPGLHKNKNQNKPRPNHADPHIIALALEFKDMGYDPIIINEEGNKTNKIPWVADKYNINSLKLLEFFKLQGVLK